MAKVDKSFQKNINTDVKMLKYIAFAMRKSWSNAAGNPTLWM